MPYPLGFCTKWMDGRIDDPDAGWKGRASGSTWSTRARFHAETGAGTAGKVMHFGLRPDPLAGARQESETPPITDTRVAGLTVRGGHL